MSPRGVNAPCRRPGSVDLLDSQLFLYSFTVKTMITFTGKLRLPEYFQHHKFARYKICRVKPQWHLSDLYAQKVQQPRGITVSTWQEQRTQEKSKALASLASFFFRTHQAPTELPRLCIKNISILR